MGISTPGLPVHVLPAMLATIAILKKKGKKKTKIPALHLPSKRLTIVKGVGLSV